MTTRYVRMTRDQGRLYGYSSCSTGSRYELHEVSTVLCVDAHMHIQSGACLPLPLMYSQVKDKKGINVYGRQRTTINRLAWFAGAGGRLSRQSTVDIGSRAIEENNATYPTSPISYAFQEDGEVAHLHEGNRLFTPMIVMPMDMEYAHIAGYDGQTIYHIDGDELFYYERESGYYPEDHGIRKNISHEVYDNDKLRLDKWEKQVEDHEIAAINNPLQLLPMYHYEPRRWQHPSGTKVPENLEYGAWDYPFCEIATATREGLFIGFKMYPPLGYHPYDRHLPLLRDFYNKCAVDQIPVLTHCSPEGMVTHEQPFYQDFYTHGTTYDPNRVFVPTKEEKENGNRWFYDNFVHPRAWAEVMENNSEMFLCLAHFGGVEWKDATVREYDDPAQREYIWRVDEPDEWVIDSDWINEIINMTAKYPNLYTDLSFIEFSYFPKIAEILRMPKCAHLKDKILFGTDWYMTMLESSKGQKQYNEFCLQFKQQLDRIDLSLWERFTVRNPLKFYGLDNREKIRKLADALSDSEGAIKQNVTDNKNLFLEGITEMERIREQESE